MNKVRMFVASFAAVLMLAGTGSAVMTNTSGDQPLIHSGHVLTSPALTSVGRILYAPSEEDDPAYRAAISAAAGGAVVDYFDARVATPDMALLREYDCVHTWANYPYADNVLFGDNLAAYVDLGGHVVLGVFCTYTIGNFLSGTIMTPAYSPVVSPSGSNHFGYSAYDGHGTTCIHAGVTAYGSFYRDYLALQGGGLVAGSFQDGEIAHAYRSDFAVVYSNGSGAVQLGGDGDWPLLLANSCACDGSTAVEETTWGRVKTFFR